MTEGRIIEMAIKPPFKYFINEMGHFGSVPESFCFTSLSKAKAECEQLLLENKKLCSIYRVYFKEGKWEERSGWLCNRIMSINPDFSWDIKLDDLIIHVAFLWNYHVRSWNPKLYDKIKTLLYNDELEDDDFEVIKKKLGLDKEKRKTDDFKKTVNKLSKNVLKKFDSFINANEELTTYVQKRYPKIRAEYAVFDRMIMFCEENENGCVEKEFQSLEEVENYYRKM